MGTSMNSLRSGDMLDKVQHSVVDVGNTSILVVAPNPFRRHLLIINDSDETIYLSHSVEAQMNFGMRVERNGGWVDFSLEKNNLCPNSIYAIQAKSQKKRLLVTEGV